MSSPPADATDSDFLDSVEGELWFFKSIMHTRPVGKHRNFHVLSMRNNIFKETGHSVSIDDLWAKLRTCYDLDALEAIDLEAEGYEPQGSKSSTPKSIPSPKASENLTNHPFFREEYSLPPDPVIESLLVTRRTRTSPSTATSANSSPEPPTAPTRGRRRGRKETKINLAGLDSDSSALTQESGDEGIAMTPAASAVGTATDPGTEEGDDEDAEMREPSPEPSTTTTKTRNKSTKSKKSSTNRVRSAAATGATTRRGKRKR